MATVVAALIAALVSIQSSTAALTNAEQGQVTDRYSRAVAQLADPTLEVRLGGIYALERVALDSPRDQATIVEVLAAYIRDHVPAAVSSQCRVPVPYEAPVLPGNGLVYEGPPTDVLAALAVLTRRPPTADGTTANLEGTCLPHTTILVAAPGRSNPAELDLADAELTESTLDGNIAGTNLSGADLQGARLGRISGATSRSCPASGGAAETCTTDLTGADLLDADLTGATLQLVGLSGAQLGGAKVKQGALHEVDLDHAKMIGADLTGTYLDDVDLSAAELSSATMTGTKLDNVDLTDAYLDGVTGLNPAGAHGVPHHPGG